MSAVDLINPVMLKELRQTVRNRSVLGAVIAFLGLELVVSWIVLGIVAGEQAGAGAMFATQTNGNTLFGWIAALLYVVIGFVLPLSTMTRLSMERRKDFVDMQFSTLLGPADFVDGKAASALVVSLSFFSAALPFLLLSFLLRGVDILRILYVSGWILAISCVGDYFAVFCGSLPASPLLRRGLFVICWGSVAWGGVGLGVFDNFIDEVLRVPSTHEGWLAAGFCLAVSVTAVVFFRQFAIRAMTSPNHERDRTLRLVFSAAILAWGVGLFLVALADNEYGWIAAWMWLVAVGTVFFMAAGASGLADFPRRVLLEAPRNAARRVARVMLASGGEGGVLFPLLVALPAWVAVRWAIPVFDHLRLASDAPRLYAHCVAASVIVGYAASYIIVLRSLWLYFLRGRIRATFLGTVALVLFLAVSIALTVVAESMPSGEVRSEAYSRFGNAFGAFEALSHSYSGGGWGIMSAQQYNALVALAVALAIYTPHIAKMFCRYRRPAGN